MEVRGSAPLCPSAAGSAASAREVTAWKRAPRGVCNLQRVWSGHLHLNNNNNNVLFVCLLLLLTFTYCHGAVASHEAFSLLPLPYERSEQLLPPFQNISILGIFE